ncbi:MAG: acyl carrier protein [Candidatus Dormibacteraeota bacterium]|nr:acyl carrier protein [Candidatus Dormibacteraeota bacterium]
MSDKAASEGQLDFAELQGIASEILGVDADRVQLDVSFAKDLAADSLDLVELIMAVEDHYQVTLPPDELDRMKKIGDLWAYLQEHRGDS